MSEHGTLSRYTNDRCRCAPCTEAQRVQSAKYRARKARQLGRHVETEAELRDALTKPEVFWW